MDCLKQIICGQRTIIGIRDFAECENPESDLFINDLSGVSLKIASKVANEEVQTGYEILKKCINIGTKKVFNDFTLKISPYFDFNAVVQTRQIDDFSEATIIPSSDIQRGLLLKRWRSELSQIYIEELYLKIDTDANVDIVIYDGDTVATTYSNVPLKAGVVKTLFIDKKYNSEQVKVVMNNKDFGVYSNSIHNWGGNDGCGTCSQGQQGFVVKGWDGTQEDSTMYGIGIKSSVRCCEENLICSIIPRMYFLIWYSAGIEIYEGKNLFGPGE
jgi:hypothetical protein